MSDLEKKIALRIKAREKIAAEMQAAVDVLAEKTKELFAHDLKTYQMLHNPDSLFNDSPISHFKTAHFLKNYMIKKDMDFLGYVLDGKPSVQPFLEFAHDQAKWINRFTKEPAPAKTGIEKII